MRQALVAGNWKMNGTQDSARALAAAIAAAAPAAVEVTLCPPAPYLETVAGAIAGSTVRLAGQDCSEFSAGAYTGETAAAMLVDLGAAAVILGHSERRQYFGDSDERVAAKMHAALGAGLQPIVCVGETIEERRAGATEEVVRRQLGVLGTLDAPGTTLPEIVIAYEPVWAIGTGESATPEQAQSVHATIRDVLCSLDGGAGPAVRILYGGSVKPDNAAELFSMPDIDGGLIGGASLDAESFLTIVGHAAGTV